uniref:Protein kinase domain-containing protein n=1 Tax=Chrysotila carterae TaxID=13221 RepID=A0A7S4EV86_CHRCT
MVDFHYCQCICSVPKGRTEHTAMLPFSALLASVHCLSSGACAQVAVKIIKRNRLKERAELLLQREVANHALLRHANIVRLYTWIKTPQRYYLVMEYCPHGDLLAFLNQKGRFTDQEARHFLRQLLEGLAFCHSLGIYHRDLKLENLMLTDSEDASGALMIKIADFGLSALKPIGLLETHCGSPLYAAPELMQDKGEYDGSKSDMWSVGVILFAMLASALPFDASDMGSLVRLICQGKPTRPIPVERGVEARQLVKALLCVDPATRPSAAEALEHEWLQTDAANDAIKASMTLDSLPTTLGDKMDRKSESKADDDDAPALARNRSAPIDRTSDGAMPAAPVVPPAKPVPTAQTEKGHVKNSELAPPAEESVRAEPAVDAAGTRQPKLPVDGAAAPSLSTAPTRGVSATSAFFKEMLAEEEARKLQKAPGEGVEEEEAGGVPSCTTRRAGAPLTKEDLAQIRAEMEREEAGDTS